MMDEWMNEWMTYAEEKVEWKSVQVSIMLNVKNFEEVLQSLRFFFILQCQHEIQISLVILFEEKFEISSKVILSPLASPVGL